MKKIAVLSAAILLIVGIVLGILSTEALFPSRPANLLSLAEMPRDCTERVLHHAYYKDILAYTDGYELLIFQTDRDISTELSDWTTDSSVTLERLKVEVPRPICSRAFNGMDGIQLPASYSAYRIEENPYSGEYVASLYDALSSIALIYRCHHPNGF